MSEAGGGEGCVKCKRNVWDALKGSLFLKIREEEILEIRATRVGLIFQKRRGGERICLLSILIVVSSRVPPSPVPQEATKLHCATHVIMDVVRAH
jgi:hypothetical protein